MKLGEALSKLKKEKSRLARLISLRKENIYTEKGKKPNFDPKELSKEIEDKLKDIRTLKIRIQKTNLQTKVVGEDILLGEALIKINDLRSTLAHLVTLFDRRRDLFYREKDAKEIVAHIDEKQIEDLVEKTEIEKSQLDNKIQMTNWTTPLVD